MRLEELPAEVLEAVGGFLAGFDAFQLSHSSRWWFRVLSDGQLWHERLVHGAIPENQQHLLHTWKRRYMQARSMLFHGLGTDDNDELVRASYACVEYPPPTDWGQFRRMYFALRTMHEESFSFDLWFCMLPPATKQETQYPGGVIFGLQSEERDSRNWPQYHQQFVMVDSNSNLYCSVLDVKTPVARGLQCERWYHLVLTYDFDRQRQSVYLDGEQVWCTSGALHREWQHLLHEQVGTGYVTAGGGDFPHGDFVGWYGFHGLLDEFRFYSGVLPPAEVRHLAQGGELSPKRLSGTLKYPGIRGPQSRINVELVACTRPAEGRSVEIVAVEPRASFPPKPCRPRAVFA
ncbi:ATP-binding Cassette (ABC) Superfamily [Phytophthora cinnamomi]|uniref:ATP-binding Cassette (ABC) Superfamily n=1 Tax=Phytophthora cinnamomi TaxID=4785 RepID=UPI00355A7553|nr:ATP-binding Cassette (ABC) Superfamily [Phytophthora cinnamomi]KAG6615941.1 ATP-binding Cassette (ABC) Superfamily [Phytophthora cinnamomi]